MPNWASVHVGDAAHVVPLVMAPTPRGAEEVPDPNHEPSVACACAPRVVHERGLDGVLRLLVIHNGPN